MSKCRAWLIALLSWLLELVKFPEPEVTDAVRLRTKALVEEANRFAPGTSGEYKRHQVYARLKKEFPATPHLGLLIEQAVIEAAEGRPGSGGASGARSAEQRA